MTALIVIGIIVLLFVLLLNVKIRAEVRYIGGVLDFKVKYLFFTIFPFRKKPEKVKKRDPEKKKSLKSQDSAKKTKNTRKSLRSSSNDSVADSDEELLNPDPDKPEEKKPLFERLDDIIEKVGIIWGFTQKGLKRLFGYIRIDGLMIDFSIAGEDAYKTALNYGRICAVIYNAIGFVQAFFRTTVKSVDIVCDFNSGKSVYDCEAKITITPSTIFSAGFILLFGFLRNYGKILGKTKTKNQPDKKKAVTV